MLKTLFYYLLVLKIIGISILIPLYSSPSAVILTLILLVSLVAIFLFNFGIVFLSLMFLIVYVGAVLILYIYSLSMLRERLQGFNTNKGIYWYLLPLYFFTTLIIQVLILNSFDNISLFYNDFSNFSLNSGLINQDRIFFSLLFGKYDEIKIISVLFYTRYIALFIVSGILLLVTLVGSISILTKSSN